MQGLNEELVAEVQGQEQPGKVGEGGLSKLGELLSSWLLGKLLELQLVLWLGLGLR